MLAAAPTAGAQSNNAEPDPIADIRSFVVPSNQARLAALTSLLKREQLPFTTQSFINTKGVAGTNVIVDLGQGDKTIVVSAHYDAVAIPNDRQSDGVVDNAGGAVALVYAAARLKSQPLGYRVRFVFFDQEELGLLGSEAFLAKSSEGIVANLNVDVAAYGDTPIFGGSINGTAGDLAISAMRQACTGRDCLFAPRMPPSDDASFTAHKIPAVLLSVLPAIEAHQLWLMMNAGSKSGLADGFHPAIFSRIHSREDRIEHVEPGAITLAADLVVWWVRVMNLRLARQK